MEKKQLARPAVKWLGGKSKIVENISRRLPEKIQTYYEPFVGGGFILFHLWNQKRFQRAVISDTNPDLINLYQILKDDVYGLIAELRNDKYVYIKCAYLEIRAQKSVDLSPVERAARMIYLNKTCFNGLYRVNRSGQFNAPFGKYTNPTILDSQNLLAINQCLQVVDIYNCGFEMTPMGEARDAFYFDPPYIPLSKTANFTSYTKDGFDMEHHVGLERVFNERSKHARVVLSNSASPASLELYRGYDIDIINGARSISGNSKHRKTVKEIIVFAGAR